jgi:hypothetical protein
MLQMLALLSENEGKFIFRRFLHVAISETLVLNIIHKVWKHVTTWLMNICLHNLSPRGICRHGREVDAAKKACEDDEAGPSRGPTDDK